MPLADRVTVSRRFQRAIRIDTDLGEQGALEGFVCPRSSAALLENMARHLSESGQGAFTWTGPYGSGKSSLVIALSALLNGDADSRVQAASLIGIDTAEIIWEAFPPLSEGWHILPVVGRRDRPEQVVGEAMESRGMVKGHPPLLWHEKQVLDELSEIAARDPDSSGGLMVFIDEMGKFLEGAARDIADVYFFSNLPKSPPAAKATLSSSASSTRPLTNIPTVCRGRCARNGQRFKVVSLTYP